MMQYWITPDCYVAVNHKVASTAIAEAIAKTFYSERLRDREVNNPFTYRGLVEQTHDPKGMPIFLLVREPVDRFLSAMAMFNRRDVTETLMDIDLMSDVHFSEQSDFHFDKAFRFPEHLSVFCEEIGIKNLPVTNIGKEKSNLSQSERGAVCDKYAQDCVLYNSLEP